MNELGQLIQIDVHPCPAQRQMCFKLLGIGTGGKLLCLETYHTSKRSPGQRLDWQRYICTELCKGDLLHKIKQEEGSLQIQLQGYSFFPPTATCWASQLTILFFWDQAKGTPVVIREPQYKLKLKKNILNSISDKPDYMGKMSLAI